MSQNCFWLRQAGVEVKDFGRSWRSGVAFHSVIHAIRPELVDLDRVKGRSNRENLEEAFSIAESELGIPRLLDPEGSIITQPIFILMPCLIFALVCCFNFAARAAFVSIYSASSLLYFPPPPPVFLVISDVDVDKPDEKSVMTYIAQFLKHYPDPHSTSSDALETDVCF